MILWAVFLNAWEYVGGWNTFQNAAFGDGPDAKPYWYTLFAPEYSFLLNNGEWSEILPALGRFFLMAVLLVLALRSWARWSDKQSLAPARGPLE